MATIIENINTILVTKNEFGNILDTHHVPRPNLFADYPEKISDLLVEGDALAVELTEEILGLG